MDQEARPARTETIGGEPDHGSRVSPLRNPGSITELVIDGSGEPIAIAALDALLAGAAAPRLSRLTITHTRATRDLWLALARSPLLASLTALDLAYGDLGDADVDDMLAVGPAFAHLGVLGLGGNYVSRARRAGVRALCPQVSLAHQRGAAADLPAINEDRILELAPDARSLMAARELALARRWPRIGSWMSTLWGSCQGSSLYDVLVDTATMQTECTCPSRKSPCKHALALLMIATRGRAIPVLSPPDGLVEACRAARHDSGRE